MLFTALSELIFTYSYDGVTLCKKYSNAEMFGRSSTVSEFYSFNPSGNLIMKSHLGHSVSSQPMVKKLMSQNLLKS